MKYYNIHADDFAISEHASKDILSLVKSHDIDSISILPNMPAFDKSIDLLRPYLDNEDYPLRISVHLNFMEGACCSDTKSVPLLVDDKGYFKVSWGSLFLASYKPWKHKQLKQQLKTEIHAQIEKMIETLPKSYTLRLDSHQHTHMIPIVWHAIKEVIVENHYNVEFIRLSKEPLTPFLQVPSLYVSYGCANIIKNILLNLYTFPIKKDLSTLQINYAYLWGLMMSGHMDYTRIQRLLPYMSKYMAKQSVLMDILFHPGSILETEITEANVKPGFVEFHLSPNRSIEYEAVKRI